jgi:hypothetical protein
VYSIYIYTIYIVHQVYIYTYIHTQVQLLYTYIYIYIYSIPPDDGLQICPKHVEVD